MSSVRSAATVTGTLALAGVGAVVALGALAVTTDQRGIAVPSALPAAFLVAGLVGARARPDHRGVQLLLAVGALHLVAFALSGWAATTPQRMAAWWLALVALVSFGAGFAALALLLAGYPSARHGSPGLRRFAAVCGTVLAVVVLAEALLSPAMPLMLSESPAAVPAPTGLPLAQLSLDLQPALPLLVVGGAVVLVVRARRASPAVRRQLEWASLAGVVLAILLLATPVASAVLPESVWTGFFVVSMSLVPAALLGGLVRHRLLDVDVLVVRTLGRGALLVGVLGCYAVAALLLGGAEGSIAASVVLTLVAAVSGGPLLRGAERLADRWFTGGRVHRGALMDELALTLVAAEPDHLPGKVCATVREGLDVSWVRLVLGGTVLAVAGAPREGQPPEASAALVAGGERLGSIHCGPRRGGWGRAERARLERLAPQLALALRDLVLRRELAARADELTRSRARLVRAEETVRRQVERDLHDGIQQQLVALLARLSVAAEQLVPDSPATATVGTAQALARDALADLRRLVSGIHPALLGDRGLTAAVEARAALLPITVLVDADPRIVDLRFAPEVEGAAYFGVSEALANVMKHSGSDRARVVVAPLEGGGLRVAVTDEGNGATRYDGSTRCDGTGLAGLRDRVEALGGRLVVQATADVGTTVLAEFEAAPALVDSDA
jgi:signal transduction histidine kinase